MQGNLFQLFYIIKESCLLSKIAGWKMRKDVTYFSRKCDCKVKDASPYCCACTSNIFHNSDKIKKAENINVSLGGVTNTYRVSAIISIVAELGELPLSICDQLRTRIFSKARQMPKHTSSKQIVKPTNKQRFISINFCY